VLVVEDEYVVSMTFKVQLEALGCEVVGSARDADSGVEMAERLQPDLVLMDIGLRGRNGLDASREIMARCPTDIIVVTAYGNDHAEDALNAGARLVLTKPILEEQLARAIAAIAGNRFTPPPDFSVEEL